VQENDVFDDVTVGRLRDRRERVKPPKKYPWKTITAAISLFTIGIVRAAKAVLPWDAVSCIPGQTCYAGPWPFARDASGVSAVPLCHLVARAAVIVFFECCCRCARASGGRTVERG
jgi:hypothetical protein